MLNVFDYLIHNEDRNMTNVTYKTDDWQTWFIDHSRSFRLHTKRPKMLKKVNLTLTPAFKQALEHLTLKDLMTLKPWLNKQQINAIWKRRIKLLKGTT